MFGFIKKWWNKLFRKEETQPIEVVIEPKEPIIFDPVRDAIPPVIKPKVIPVGWFPEYDEIIIKALKGKTALRKYRKSDFYWVCFFKAVAKAESNHNPYETYWERDINGGVDPVTGMKYLSEGLLQLSYVDKKYHGCNFCIEDDKDKDPSDISKSIFQPENNLACGVKILNKLMKKHATPFWNRGHYWAVLKPNNKRHKVFKKYLNQYLNEKPVIIDPAETNEPIHTEFTNNIIFIDAHTTTSPGAKNYKGEYENSFSRRINGKVIDKLVELGYSKNVFRVTRPHEKNYTGQCSYVAKKCKSLKITHAISTHFNAAGIEGARGTEWLTANDKQNAMADYASDLMNTELGVKERHGNGVLPLTKGHRGSGMVFALDRVGVNGVIAEPVFADYDTEESRAVFEHEDRYVTILVKVAIKAIKGEF